MKKKLTVFPFSCHIEASYHVHWIRPVLNQLAHFPPACTFLSRSSFLEPEPQVCLPFLLQFTKSSPTDCGCQPNRLHQLLIRVTWRSSNSQRISTASVKSHLTFIASVLPASKACEKEVGEKKSKWEVHALSSSLQTIVAGGCQVWAGERERNEVGILYFIGWSCHN